MEHQNKPNEASHEFSRTEGMALALNYLHDPSDVPCPSCGPDTMEVVAYLDAGGIQKGVVRASDPTGDYTVVLYCHECRRAAALDLSPDRNPLSGGRDPELDADEEDRRAA